MMFSLVPVHMKRAGAVAPLIVGECCVIDQHKRKYYIDVKEKLEIANLSMFYTLETYFILHGNTLIFTRYEIS